MRRRWIAVGLLLIGAGCNRQDAEGLGRIGSLVAHRLEKLKPSSGPAADAKTARPASATGGSDAKPDAEPQK
jgi:hypothetical protein